MKRIGWTGVGIMGRSMVRNLTKAGFELHIYARTEAKVEDVIHKGATFYKTMRNCIKGREAAITMVGFPRDVGEVYFVKNNILSSVGIGAYLTDMTTTSPALAKRLSGAGTARGYHIIDAPVAGGDRGAHNGILFTMVDDGQKDYEACSSLFQAMGENIRYHGKVGCGQHAKLANQIVVAGTLSGICEALIYAKAQGLDLQTVFDSVSTGSIVNRQPSSLAPKTMDDGYAPGFSLKHFVKDTKLALEETDAVGLDLAVLWQALSNSKELEDTGCGDLGMQVLIEHYE